jgi:methyl-accepting chemotaxis protein
LKTEEVEPSCDQVNAMLRQVLRIITVRWVDVLFEPNAFDGRDLEFVNTEGSDANGRFLPYWTRGSEGKIQVELLQDYDVSDWYQCPKTTKVSCLIDPYVYPVQGEDVWMTSLVIPFVYEDTFLGITGIDTPITFLQELADQVDIFNGEGSCHISNNGRCWA